VVGAQKRADGRQAAAAEFVADLWGLDCPRVCVENPIGWLNTNWRKADQILHPWMFGHPWMKETCLWLRGLPPLTPTDVVQPQGFWVGGDAKKSGKHRNPRERARTFPGVAAAMANQWA
jgi:hypothetical protein